MAHHVALRYFSEKAELLLGEDVDGSLVFGCNQRHERLDAAAFAGVSDEPAGDFRGVAFPPEVG
ncbi:hypothetical protein D3C86_2037050 [compost metagenome]